MRYVVFTHNSNVIRQPATTFSRKPCEQLMCTPINMAHNVLNTFSLILTFVVQGVAVNLVGCGLDKPLVVQENTQNYTIVCEDIRSDNDVRWVLTRTVANRTGSNVGYCTGDSSVCAGGNPLFSFSRPRRNISIVQIAKVDRSMFGMANVTCSGISQTGELVVINSSCNIDIIYISENISCKTEFMKDTWTVFGHCDIYKTSSSHNRYRCTWIEINESFRESVVIANTPMTVVPFAGTYVNGSCNFTSHLPPAGLYTYHVTVIPGEVTVNASFIGSNEIHSPRVLTFNMNNIGSKTVNVDENAHVEMRCNSDGKPTPKIQLYN
ncbi:uncharacterized protein LOC112567580 [Pomacea canaliculata]|uniref:uncharacterized protein LOC112567580 n=1 Tax=Pomacea canaliculata TaxID=400727 RepID=UPI000D730EA5|nr:uncharacterized protein LOC112567580 [Pomacea canaliculata]